MKKNTITLLKNYAEIFETELSEKINMVKNDDYDEEEIVKRTLQIQNEVSNIEKCIEWLNEKTVDEEPYQVKENSNLKFVLLCVAIFILIIAFFITLSQFGIKFNFRRVLA